MPLIEYIPTYRYFSAYHCWNQDHCILDFGSNSGNLIKSSHNQISEHKYTAIDVDAEAIAAGQESFPDASWHCYNRHNPVYNPSHCDELPGIPGKFDAIFSYSVFSHTSWSDTDKLVEHLWHLLTPGGRMYITVCDAHNPACVEWFRSRRQECDVVPSTDSVIYLIDNKVSTQPALQQCGHFVAFYNLDWLRAQWQHKFHIEVHQPPAGWMQNCIIFQKPKKETQCQLI